MSPEPDALLAAQQVEATLGGALQSDMKMRIVRDVAPNKEMICISFRVPEFCRVAASTDERDPKRARADRGTSE